MILFFRSILIITFMICMAYSTVYYVATDGDNTSGDGSIANPWLTIDHAAANIPSSGGDTICVRDGLYNGRNYITEAFNEWIVIKAEHAYKAKLTNIQDGKGSEAFGIFTPHSAKIIVQGFIISNVDEGYVCTEREENVLIHFQDACDIVFQNNIVFGNNVAECCNELLKINRGGEEYYPRNIHVRGNVFYDHVSAGGADIIDAVRPGELDIYENILFTRSSPNAQSFITLKRQVQEADMPEEYKPARNPRHRVYRNVFLNWDGKTDQAFIQFGEDAQNEYMITNSIIENNLFIGNSSNNIVAAIQLKGAKNITMRANTITGNLPGSTYGFRIGTEGENPPIDSFFIYNNIWSDPTGTMGNRFINTFGDVDISSFELNNNLFWNAGNDLPDQGSVLPSTDENMTVADPKLEENQDNIILPVWDEDNNRFLSGNKTIREEFERLVHTYGAIPRESQAKDKANPTQMPIDDILGRKRDTLPDIGAYEYIDSIVSISSDYSPAGINSKKMWYFPNPFQNCTRFFFYPSSSSLYSLTIYNYHGKLIKIFKGNAENEKLQSILWDGCDGSNKRIPAGMYICRLRTGRNEIVRRVMFLR